MTLLSLRNTILSIKIANSTEGRKRYLFLFELMLIALIYAAFTYAWKEFAEPGLSVGPDFYILGLINIAIWSIFYKFTIIAKLPRTRRYLEILFQFVRVSFFAAATLILIKYILGLNTINILFILFYSGFNLFVIFHTRVLSYSIFKTYRAKGRDLHRVIVIADWHSDVFINKILEEKEWGFKISKVITDSRLIIKKFGKNLDILPESTDIKNIIDHEIIDEVIYCKGLANEETISRLAEICNEIGVIFRLQSNLSPLDENVLQYTTLNNSGKLSLVDAPSNNTALLIKQISDIYFSLIMLILLSPVFLLMGIIIKLDSRGPALFVQERVGLRGRKFLLYKFRTMVLDAENMIDELQAKNEADGPVFKIKSDPRITRFGSFLRKTGLDELPQLYNVLKGEMSLIGPRPSLPSEVQKYERWQLRRLSVKPGITCTWQIIPNKNEVKFENWMKLDLQYIDKWNLLKDAGLFLRTVKTFFTAMGN